MSEKVKLPKSVCDALKELINDGLGIGSIFIKFHRRELIDKYPQLYTGEIWDHHIMSALVLGFEPEMSQPERELKELVQNTFNGEKDLYDMGYRYGAWDALRIHGIHYDWLEGAE